MEPRQFGNYTLLERVSHGGMAEVFRAKSFGEAGFEREVALKLLLPSMASDKEFVDMLIDEAKIAGQLNHANIAQIFDLGAVDGRYYIVQEFVQGQDLRAVLKRKASTKTKLKVSTACHIAIKVCEGLHYAHNKEDHFGKRLNLVHRDISPHNILISNEGEVKIIDFGIAKADGRSTQTMAGLVKGKFAYMSPEQIRGLPVDHRSDVFATGILLHEMLTARPLFQAGTEFETLKRARAAHADPPSLLNPAVPPELDAIALKALARHVDDRYQSARELRDELWAFARANNAFAGHEQLTSMNPDAPQADASIQLDIASEILGNPEELLISRTSDQDAAEEETTPGDERTTPGDERTTPGDERTTPGDERTAPAEDFIVSERTGPSEPQMSNDYGADDYSDDPSESRTVVDEHFAGIDSSSDEVTDIEDGVDDFDAQWAADVGGPLPGAPSPSAVPARSHALPRERNPDEETTAGGRTGPHERPTDRFIAASLPEHTGEEAATLANERERRASTAPALRSKAAAKTTANQDNPYANATTTKRDRRMALAQTEPISAELLARAVGETPTIPAGAMSPADVVAAAARRPQGGNTAPAPQPFIPSAQQDGSQPMPMQQHGSQPVPMPMQQHGSQPVPMPMQQHGSQPVPMPMQQHGSQPVPMPMQQHGSQPVPMPMQQHGSQPVPMPMQQHGSQPVPMPMQQHGSAPVPLPQQYGSQPISTAQNGSAPMQVPQSYGSQPGYGSQPPQASAAPQRRSIFVLSAVFLLLLAVAATLTLIITD